MKLTLDKIREITCGAETVTENDGSFSFCRFTAEQSHMYKLFRNLEFCRKTFATAGVRLAFTTDSQNLSFDYTFGYGSSRPYGWFDIYENGILTDHVGSDSLLHSQGHADIKLAEGIKKVEVYFPWSKAASISDVTLDDGAVVSPVKRSKTMINYGDSITHGYDAVYPSLSYASQISALLDADSYNKAIGGDTFFPQLLALTEPVSPDIVTVAYGTNDWSKLERPVYEQTCTNFYQQLSEKFPNAKIFAITPIWRADDKKETAFGAPLSAAREMISNIAGQFNNVTLIDGVPLTPHFSEFYSDEYLHPNDLGFCQYAQRLYLEISKYL
ncbi:MAG: hypothetical protein HFE63_04890 [Clostridiales bacterium]|nr:hypothetical protein [Clostridiales bacterium]